MLCIVSWIDSQDGFWREGKGEWGTLEGKQGPSNSIIRSVLNLHMNLELDHFWTKLQQKVNAITNFRSLVLCCVSTHVQCALCMWTRDANYSHHWGTFIRALRCVNGEENWDTERVFQKTLGKSKVAYQNAFHVTKTTLKGRNWTTVPNKQS